MPQLAVAAVGAWIGSMAITGTVMGMTGAAIGWSVGGIVGSLLFAPDGPKADLQETRASKLQFGAKIPRVRGRGRMPLNPRWQSDWRSTSHESGGKGGGGGSQYYTYSADGLFWVCEGIDDAIGVRLWENGKLVWSSIADSDDESLLASEETPKFSAINFHDGNDSQLPWSVYEAAVGTADADAHRGIFCVSLENYQAGTNPQWGFLEIEFVEAYTDDETAARTLLQSRFLAFDPDDESAYARGTPTISATGATFPEDGELAITNPDGGLHHVTYAPAGLYSNGTDALTFEAIIRNDNSPASSPGVLFVLGASTYHFYWPSNGPPAYLAFNIVGGIGDEAQTAGDAGIGEDIHVALVFGSTSYRVYVAGSLLYSQAGDFRPPNTDANSVVFGNNTSGGSNGPASIGFRVRQEEVYTGSSFSPPTEIEPPDGTLPKYSPLQVDLKDVMDGEMLRCGLTADQIDNSELEGIPVTGMVFQSNGRESAERGASAYYFGATCRDKLITRLRGASSVASIPYEDSGAALDDAGDPFTGVDRGNDLEVPAHWIVSSPDIDADYENGSEESARVATDSVERRQVQLPVVFTPQERKGRANAYALDARISSHGFSISVDDSYAKLEPFDVVTLTDEEGNTYRGRLVKETYAQGCKSFEGVQDDQTALPTTAATASPYEPNFTVAAIEDSTLLLLDIPILRDADNDPGFYIVGYAESFTGMETFESLDGTVYTPQGALTNGATAGTATDALDDVANPWVVDHVSSVTVASNKALASYSFDAVMAGTPPPYLIGDEIVYAMTATLVSGTTYTLTNLLRGLKGTEWATGTHEAGERFVVLQSVGIRRGEREAGELNVEYQFKGRTFGQPLSAVTAQAFTDKGVGLKPYAVVDLEAAEVGSDTEFSWNRRTRLSCTLLGEVEIALGELSESYDVELYDDTDTLVESATVSVTSYTTSIADLTDHTLLVYQKSAIVGRGYVAELAL